MYNVSGFLLIFAKQKYYVKHLFYVSSYMKLGPGVFFKVLGYMAGRLDLADVLVT